MHGPHAHSNALCWLFITVNILRFPDKPRRPSGAAKKAYWITTSIIRHSLNREHRIHEAQEEAPCRISDSWTFDADDAPKEEDVEEDERDI